MQKQSWSPTFRMKQLPKSEYQLMRRLIEQYQLDDPSELFTALLRLAAEVQTFTNSEGADGAAWLQRLITETVTALRQ